MRDTVDRYVENGGSVARFAGNFLWQIRIEDEGRTQICYKCIADQDPLMGTERAHLVSVAVRTKIGADDVLEALDPLLLSRGSQK